MDDLATKHKLVLAGNKGEIILDGEEVVIELRHRVRAATHRELIRHGKVQAVGNILVDIYAKRIRIDVICSETAVVPPP